MTIIDLTRRLHPDTAVYRGDPPVRFLPHCDYGEHGFRVTELRLGTHVGTHVDAPSHFLPEGAGVDEIRLETLVGPARVLDLDAAGSSNVLPGERLLLRTGWGARWGDPAYFHGYPGVPAALADRLAAAPAALLGLDTPSLHPDPECDGEFHRRLLAAGVVIVENLANLELLPERVFLAALPLPLTGLDGSPCRVIAITEGGLHGKR